MGRGIPLEVENIKAFTACLQTVFVRTGQVAECIGRLANQDVRRCLQLTREIVASPHIGVADLLKAFFAKSTLEVSTEDIKLAIIRGKYDIYPTGTNSFVQNVFDLVPGIDTTPLIAVRALSLLKATWDRNPDNDARYLPLGEIVDYLQEMGIEPRSTVLCLNCMLRTGLILDYDPTTTEVSADSCLQVSPSGRQHLQWALGDWVYLESMAVVTPLLDRGAHDEIRTLIAEQRSDGLRAAIARFVQYLLAEDGHYVLVPVHNLYQEQLRIADILREHDEKLKTFPAEGRPGRYARRCGRIARWDREKCYGFVRQGDGSRDAFLHINDVIGANAAYLLEGAYVEYDVVAEERGPKAINGIEIPST
jgi:cold shock CspA family protein